MSIVYILLIILIFPLYKYLFTTMNKHKDNPPVWLKLCLALSFLYMAIVPTLATGYFLTLFKFSNSVVGYSTVGVFFVIAYTLIQSFPIKKKGTRRRR